MNKFMKKIMSKKDGFTLVELIVVIAILAILAGVAVPVYSGYIAKAEAVQDDNLIASIETALNSAAVMNGATIADVDDISISEGVATFKFGDEATATDFAAFINSSVETDKVSVKVSGFKYATDLTYANGQLTISSHN